MDVHDTPDMVQLDQHIDRGNLHLSAEIHQDQHMLMGKIPVVLLPLSPAQLRRSLMQQ